MIYNKTPVNYKGINLKTQSKEYTYLSKSKGAREKINWCFNYWTYIRSKINEKISKIRELEAKTMKYDLVFDSYGQIESKHRIPSLKINYIFNFFI